MPGLPWKLIKRLHTISIYNYNSYVTPSQKNTLGTHKLTTHITKQQILTLEEIKGWLNENQKATTIVNKDLLGGKCLCTFLK